MKTLLTCALVLLVIEANAAQADIELNSYRPFARVDHREALQKHLISWTFRGGLVTITLLVGWFVGDWYFGRDQRQLIEDLPVIDRLDEFRLTEDLEFLQQLVDAGLFDEESPNDE